MPLVLVTPPDAEPLALAEAKAHLRVDGPEDDAYVQALITAARMHVETTTQRALVTQGLALVLDGFPNARHILLPRGKLQEVTEVTYRDAEGAEQTLSTENYEADTASEPGRIVLAPSASWPTTEEERSGAVRIEYDVGYGGAADVPQPIKAAMLLIVGHLYEHRESEIVGVASSPLHLAIDALLGPYRTTWGFH